MLDCAWGCHWDKAINIISSDDWMSWKEMILIPPLTDLDQAPPDTCFTTVPSSCSLLSVFLTKRDFFWSADSISNLKGKKKCSCRSMFEKKDYIICAWTCTIELSLLYQVLVLRLFCEREGQEHCPPPRCICTNIICIDSAFTFEIDDIPPSGYHAF